MARPLVLAAILLAASATAHASERDIASRIDRVTVFPDGAGVTRLAEIDLPAGASSLVLRGLPANLDPASVRIAGEGAAVFAIGAIDVRVAPGEPQPSLDPASESRLRKLREERDAAAARLTALETRKAAIERYAQAGPERQGEMGRPMPVEQWSAAWDAIGTGMERVGEDIRVTRARIAELEAELRALEQGMPRPQRPGPRRNIVVALDAPAPVKGRLTIEYRVAGAGWQPLYDARLATTGSDGKPSLELVRRAAVTQRTGEDWRGVALTVSTVRVARGTAAPDLPPLQADFQMVRPLAEAMVAQDSMRATSARQRLEKAPPAAAPVVAVEPEASVEAGAFQVSFTVPGRVDVAADGAPTSLRLASRTLAPELSVKTVPALDTTAYLEAAFDNADAAPLLPGRVALHRDGAYVGAGRVGLIGPGAKITLGFGADDGVKVTREPVSRQETEPGFLNNSRTDTRDFRILVKNLHRFAIPVTVVDRIPFSENANLTVEQLPQTTPPSVKQVDNMRGVMAWTGEIAPGGQREIRVAYRLRWPADREIDLRPAPVR